MNRMTEIKFNRVPSAGTRILVLTIVASSSVACFAAPVVDTIGAKIAACGASGCHIELEAGKDYLETKPWNLRGKNHVTISGYGNTVYFGFDPEAPPGVAIDASGAMHLHFSGWRMALPSKGGRPSVGLLLARNTKNKSSGSHHFERWSIQGWYTKAAVAAIASEVNVWIHCFLTNSHPNSAVYWTGRSNELGIVSPFGAFGSGSTNTCHDFIATGFGHYGMVNGENSQGVTIVLGDGTHDFHLRGGTMSMRGNKGMGSVGGRCGLLLGSQGKRPVINVLLDAVEWETVGAKHTVVVSRRAEGLSIRDSLLEAIESVLHVEKNGVLFDSIVESSRLIAGIGNQARQCESDAVITVQGHVEASRFDLRGRRLIPLKRDIAGRCARSLYVDDKAKFVENEVRLRLNNDAYNYEQIKKSNDLQEKDR